MHKKKFEGNYAEDRKYRKVRDHCHYTGEYRGTAQRICNLKYITLKENTITFHNGLNYNYHFIKKELAEEFKGKFRFLGKILKNI